MEKLPSKAVIDAVDASSGGKVIASDVAASAGVSLSQARKDLTALASLTRGDIAVSQDGELIYLFPSGVKSALSANSAKYKAIELFAKVKEPLFYLVRVSFGVVLLASLVAIFSTIFFISQGSSSDDDRRRDNRGGGGFGGMNMWWGPSPFDFFYYRPYGYYYASPGQPRRDPDEMGFLESVFSYVFGDGNPNEGLEERRLSLVANLIRENKGAVTAEQLAPFCDDAPSPKKDSAYVDESFVLPLVTQLNGEPRVTEDGDIIYVFPELQMSASSSSRATLAQSSEMILRRAGLSPNASVREIKQLLTLNGINSRGALEKKDLLRILEKALPPMTAEEEEEVAIDDPSILTEREYKFSLAPSFNRVASGGLGVVNLAGALYLGNMLSTYAMYGVRLPSYFGLIQSAYPLLLGYAALFNIIPLARSFWIKTENTKIQQRNKIRREWRSALGSGVNSLARKLNAAKKMRTQMKQLGANEDEIVFDTRRSMEETEQSKEKISLDEFDKLLGSDDKSFQ